jgi:phage baseplate assembly protein W
MNITYPWQFDRRGRTAEAESPEHIRQMIEQVLFTSPGERVNRPEFGCGVMQILFSGNSVQLAAALQANIQAALNRWLGDVIEVHNLDVSSNDATVNVVLQYVLIRTGQPQTEVFSRRANA